ncbi:MULTISPECIES: histidine--tRNA ligase [unclassified Frigoribacterium]|jgi:histidyl-tRNA synthetase|uniref:histidine--tRNA ligase n=1 Tax=unclassified Frigoribacterium TaxID=2627005 RepID=UPI0012F2EE22|nr:MULTISPECIES: histidine--tRNA ligase [unclassified Frigoribacterium]MBD8139958.1 histidine--tRNA ligase [Frigoribacterium sp. CFBP 13605]WAC52744.1 histidine--tRNA ligase [Frigoribacterium sp. SL97]VXB61554.1 Histidine--tRNA ligase [Frigoribacterium sp. 9N]
MPTPVNPPRGMRDHLPADKRRREGVLSVIRGVYRSYGFDEIETPVVEESSRLHSGLGGDNEKQVFAVLRRGLDLDDLRSAESVLGLADLGLRFDLTVPLARFYASHRAELPTVFRSVQIAPVWRAERPQKGRYRQFVQCDIDVLGEAGPLAEIELIQATTAVLDALGLTGTTIRVNDRRILLAMLAHWAVPEALTDQALIVVDKLDKIGVDGVVAELADLGVTTPGLGEALTQLAGASWATGEATDVPWLDRAAFADLVALREALPGSTLEFDPTLVRGMGYYTGTIFEIAHPDVPYSLGGGGRYDGMIGRFLGSDVPAAGFSLGFERLVDLVTLEADGDEGLAVVYDKKVEPVELLALQRALLAGGERRVRLEKKAKNFTNQLDGLAAAGFGRFVTVRGGESAADLEVRTIG